MKKHHLFKYVKFCPIIGIGWHIDYYNKAQHGFDAEQHTLILPFIIFRVVRLYEFPKDEPTQVSA